jgi:1,4-dihydroxy-6-naphthoate synthase
MKLTIGFSPCPNDTFIFDALVNGKIDRGDYEFEVLLEDVQTLNEWAINDKLDVTKISYGVLPLILNQYSVLHAGGALGQGVGPLLIRKESQKPIPDFDSSQMTVAIPGKNTTAHLLFSAAYPQTKLKKFMLFSEIENAVLNGDVDAGVIIHENRFTYMDKGLVKIIDLGDYWEKETGFPIPLGGIIMKKSYDIRIQKEIDALIKKSIEYAFEHYPAITSYVKEHSQEMEEKVMRQHIDLYVNEFSIDVSEKGKAAVMKLLSVYQDINGEKFDGGDVFAY